MLYHNFAVLLTIYTELKCTEKKFQIKLVCLKTKFTLQSLLLISFMTGTKNCCLSHTSISAKKEISGGIICELLEAKLRSIVKILLRRRLHPIFKIMATEDAYERAQT